MRHKGFVPVAASIGVAVLATGIMNTRLAARADSDDPTCGARVTEIEVAAVGSSRLYIVKDETEIGRNTGHQLLYLESNGVAGLQRDDWVCKRPGTASDFLVVTTGQCQYHAVLGLPDC